MTAPKRLRVLLVEDSRDDEALVTMELGRAGYEVVHKRVETARAMREALDLMRWDVILSDYSLPAFSGPEALAIVKGLGVDVPFIIVSGSVGEEAAVAAMKVGAHDYVLKDRLARLCPAIERALRDAAIRDEQRKMREQLLISERMASVGTLAAGVAHEINNPLAAVIANLELMTKDLQRVSADLDIRPRMEEIFEELKDARESADRLRHIVRDLKIFSRSSEEERRVEVDIKRVLDSSIRMAWNEIRHRAQLVKEYGDIPLVEANEARLGQVFLNLIVNAAQAIPEGDAEHNLIQVSAQVDDATGQVVVSIRDTGCGIPADNLSRVFDAFFTTKPIGVGTGLGLSICHRIIANLGGEVELDSEVGKGTTFRVRLRPSRVAEKGAAPVTAVVPPVRRGRLLVVDDEPMVARAVARTLNGEHDVSIATGAGDALSRITAGERFDIILCDLMMPQMTGMDLHAELLRAVPQQAAQMIFVTGGAFTPGAREFLDNVPNQRIEKPFDPQHFRALINDRIK